MSPMEAVGESNAEMDAGLPVGTLRRERFIRDHHHLMSPWAYSHRTIVERNAVLLRRQWGKQHG